MPAANAVFVLLGCAAAAACRADELAVLVDGERALTRDEASALKGHEAGNMGSDQRAAMSALDRPHVADATALPCDM